MGLAQFDIECAATTVARMGGLIANDVTAKLGLVKPQDDLAAQTALALGRVKHLAGVKGMAGVGRGTLSGYNKNQPVALMLLGLKIGVEFHAGRFDRFAVEIDARVRFHLAA